MSNLVVIDDLPIDAIDGELIDLDIDRLHFSNGYYDIDPSFCVPTVLAGFKHIDDFYAEEGDAFCLAINTDVSAKNAGKDMEPQGVRAEKVLRPLSLLFPKRTIIGMFFDELTPGELYEGLEQRSNDLLSLFKWGYGTNEKEDPIVGATRFETVHGHPLPKDVEHFRPAGEGDTPKGENQDNVVPEDLTSKVGRHGRPYLTRQNKALFPVPAELHQFAALSVRAAPQHKI